MDEGTLEETDTLVVAFQKRFGESEGLADNAAALTFLNSQATLFKQRFEAFANLTDERVILTFADAFGQVDEVWLEEDRQEARFLLTAHYLVQEGATSKGATTVQPHIVTSRKIGDATESYFVSNMTTGAAAERLMETPYGQRFLTRLSQNRMGPVVV